MKVLLFLGFALAGARELSSAVRTVASSAENSYRSGFAYPVEAHDGAVVFPSYSTPTTMAITSVTRSGKTTTLASTSATQVPGGGTSSRPRWPLSGACVEHYCPVKD